MLATLLHLLPVLALAIVAALMSLTPAQATPVSPAQALAFTLYAASHPHDCSVSHGALSCTDKDNKLIDKKLPDTNWGNPNLGSMGPVSSNGPCGNGYWSNPMPGICNIALSEDFNHGKDSGTTIGALIKVKACEIKTSVLTISRAGADITTTSMTNEGMCHVH